MRKILMDCDTGGDDASAISLAVASHDLELLGVTTCMGNRPIEQTYKNTRELIGYFGVDVPVAKGSEKPLKRDWWVGNKVDTPLPVPGLKRDVLAPEIEMDAVEFMADVLRKSDEKVTLIPLAPLTNIAKLMMFYPDLVDEKVDEIIIMGGGMYFGNTTGAAELNIYADAEAAACVFSFGKPIVMHGLDVCYRAKLFAKEAERLLNIKTKTGQAFANIVDAGIKYRLERGLDFSLMYDSLPIIYALHPEIFTVQEASVTVEISGELTYGQTICNPVNSMYDQAMARSMSAAPKDKKIHKVVMDIDREKYLDIVEDILTRSDI